MALNYHPRLGTLLICDFTTGFKAPEMVKKRPVVVVSRTHRCIAIVVPLSKSEPTPFEKCHVEMSAASIPADLGPGRRWAKCDMASHVCFDRLDRIKAGRCPNTGKRLYITPAILDVDLKQIQQALRHVLSL